MGFRTYIDTTTRWQHNKSIMPCVTIFKKNHGTRAAAAAASLSVLLGGELGAGVGDADVELSRALHDLLALARGHVVGDFCRVLPAHEPRQNTRGQYGRSVRT